MRGAALEAQVLLRQLIVGGLERRAEFFIVRVREPEDKAWAEVVVAGELVVEAEAVRALA